MEIVFNVISTILNVVIALAALIIAVIEFKGRNKEKKIEEETRELIKRIVNGPLEESAEWLKDHADEYLIGGDKEKITFYRTRYRYFKRNIDSLYTNMLQNENMFSLSYGFDRYIKQFGDFLENADEYDNIFTNISEENTNKESQRKEIEAIKKEYKTLMRCIMELEKKYRLSKMEE